MFCGLYGTYTFMSQQPLGIFKAEVSMIEVKLVEGQRITSPYGWRIHPILKKRKFHNGVDIVGDNEKLLAIANGEIIDAGHDDVSGNWIKVRYLLEGASFVFSYCHLKSSLFGLVKYIVKPGEWIADMGSSGLSTAIHLHLTVKRNGITINPENYFKF